ncbi:tyrosine-type recombinase/integrase [Listeria costaricensis]|uniref:site-specific integrase n=1 Tax=Listeria costaricensis TaxID=2026604 RepID=UPI000C06B6DB|nr:tyrosine-type recombinase/integrase [Listeria costaricensis]
MASVHKYETKKGTRWLVKMELGIDPMTGKRKSTTKRGFLTQKEAKREIAKIYTELENQKFIMQNKILFTDFIDVWFKHYQDGDIKKSTINNRRTTALPHLKHYLGQKNIDKISRYDYDFMLKDMHKQGYSHHTISTTNIVGKMIFRFAQERGIIHHNYVQTIKTPAKSKSHAPVKLSNIEDEYLERDELISLLSVAKEYGSLLDYASILTLSYTGLRVGELLALQWTDIDFNKLTISVWKTLFREKNTITTYELTTPKTAKANRKIVMSESVADILVELQEAQQNVKQQFPDYHDENFVFSKLSGNYCGYPEMRHRLGQQLKSYLQKAGIRKNITLHKLRHTHISLLAQAGVDLATIQERVGHENAETTTKIYLHITKEMKHDSINKFTQLMENNSSRSK